MFMVSSRNFLTRLLLSMNISFGISSGPRLFSFKFSYGLFNFCLCDCFTALAVSGVGF